MKRETNDTALHRRHFLRALGGASTVAVAAASPIAATEAQAYDPGAEETQGPLSRDRSRQGLLPHQRLRDPEEVRPPC